MAKISKDPSTMEVLDFLRSGTPGVDLSAIPISAGLGVEVEFTLELVKKEWRLKRGRSSARPPAVKAMAGGLATSEESADTADGKGKPPQRLEGINDKGAMPADLPVWPRAKAETYNVGQRHAAGYQRVRARSDSVLRLYRKTVPEKGWKLAAESEGAGGVLLLYQKAGRTARVEVVADTGLTEIWLRSQVAEKPNTEKK
ncbi:MAG: hypothetical protein ACREMZ_10060 [Gemmatimonadales bacterium]